MTKSPPILAALLFVLHASAAAPVDPPVATLGDRAPQSGIPDLLYSTVLVPDRPIWVSAERALDADGEIRSELFGPSASHRISLLLSGEQEDGCIRWSSSSSWDETPAHRSDLASAVLHAENIVVVTPIDRATGFLDGTAGTMLRVELTRVLKGAPRTDDRFLFLPIADLELGDTPVCKRNPLYPPLPAAGDQMLVFFRTSWNETEDLLRPEGPSGLVTLPRDGAVRLPTAYLESDPGLRDLRTDELLALVMEQIQ